MQGIGTRGRLGRPDGMSTLRRIQNCDLRLVRPVPQTHPAHQAQSEILADVKEGRGNLTIGFKKEQYILTTRSLHLYYLKKKILGVFRAYRLEHCVFFLNTDTLAGQYRQQ